VDLATGCARAAPGEGLISLADQPASQEWITLSLEREPRAVPMAEVLALAEEWNEVLLGRSHSFS
jgi:hypothetical protein